MKDLLPYTAVIILAAGESSRLGRPKQLVDFKGQPLLQHTLNVASLMDFGSKVLVLGANGGRILSEMEATGFEVVVNESWEEGIASSIREGAQAAIANPQIEHLLFLLSDQPYLSADLLQNLMTLHAADPKRITASQYGGSAGVPAIFHTRYLPELMELQGDDGAKKIMKRHPVSTVDFGKGDVDVDTPEDVDRLGKG